MNLDPHFSYRLNGCRKRNFFDPNNEEHQEIEKAALVFRESLYKYAKSLFQKSPKFLDRLKPKKVGGQGNSLVLFSEKTIPRIKNAKEVILHFLITGADFLVHPDEQNNLKLLINYVKSFNIEKQEDI